MTAMYPRLARDFPAQSVPEKGSAHASVKALGDWLQSLPLANGLSAARTLLQAVGQSNASRMDGMQRLSALEMLRASVSQMVAQIDRQVIGSAFPLPQAKQQLGVQACEFHQALALGYRMAAYELCQPEGKVGFLKGKTVATALVRAASHHGEQLLRGYFLYSVPQAGVWQHLHDLYRFGQQVELLDKSVDDPLLGKLGRTLQQVYAHAVLMALCNPFRLSQKEMIDAFAATRIWAADCRVEPRANANAIGLAMDQDRGPGYVPEDRDYGELPQHSFDVTDLLRSIDRDLTLSTGLSSVITLRAKGGEPVNLAPEFVQRLLAAWRPVADRHFSRLPAGHYLDTLVGLHGIHYHLAGLTEFEQFVRDIRGPGIVMTERDKSASWMNALGDSARPVALRSKVLDQGLGGYRLEWGQESGAKARIGELVGLAAVGDDRDTEREWMIGAIRWLRFGGSGRVQAGVELLARAAVAAAVRAADNGGHFRAPVRAIECMSLNNQADEPPCILTPSLVDRGLACIEVSRAPDPWGELRGPLVQVLNDLEILENTGAYLRLRPRVQAAAAHESVAA
ncbi:MAG: hypothetical protein AB7F83_06225 [Lysobacterales bacterium]